MQKPCIFKGVATALVTPMTDDYRINYKEFQKLIEYQMINGADALVVCGTTGEASALSADEYKEAITFVVKLVDHQIPVLVGTGSNNTKTAVDRTKLAAKIGADCALVVTPYYNKTTQNGLVRHYAEIADSSPIPVLIYNVPSRTGITVKPETYAKLAEHPNIIGTKEANGNVSQILKAMTLVESDFTFYSGNDDLTLSLMANGAKGVISVISNLVPKETKNFVSACANGNYNSAFALYRELRTLMDLMFIEVNPLPIKYAMNYFGFSVGPARPPLYDLSPESKRKIEQYIEKLRPA